MFHQLIQHFLRSDLTYLAKFRKSTLFIQLDTDYMYWTKRFLGIFFTLLAIVLITFAFILNSLDPNQFRFSINQALTKAIGHNTNIKGQIDWGYFPSIRLNINQIEISDNHKPLAEIGQLQGAVSLIDLLFEKVTIKKLYVKSLNLQITLNEKGENNWFRNDPPPPTPSQDVTQKADNNKTGKKKKHTLGLFELRKITIEDGNITFSTPTSNLQFKHVNFNANNVSLKHAMSYELNTLLSGKHKARPVSSNINLKGTVFIYPSEEDIGNNGIKSNADIIVNGLRYGDMRTKTIKAGLSLDKKHFIFNLNRLNAYKGTATGLIDYSAETQVLLLQSKINNVNIGKLLKDLDDIKLFDGLLTASFKVSSKGKTQQALLNHLNGKGKIDIEKGRLVDIDVNGIIRWVDSLLLNHKSLESIIKSLGNISTYTNLFTQQSTPFDILTGQAIIEDGVANFNNIDLSAKTLRVHGGGNISIKDQTIDLKLKAVTPDKYDPESALKKAFGRAGIPFRIHGKLSDPSVTPDTKAITESISKRLWHNVSKDLNSSIRSINRNLKNIKKIIK